jgi:Protein of unknown function (DUF2934)
MAKGTGGNRTAARSYNKEAKAQRRLVTSRSVEEKAREGERGLDGPEARDFAEAEAAGRRHTAEEDPAVHRSHHETIRARAYESWEQEGRPHGRDREHWHQAETEMRNP